MAKRIPTAVYTDGGLLTHNPSTVGGTWGYVVTDQDDCELYSDSGTVLASRLKVPVVSNNMSEHVALIKAIESLPDNWSGRICSDSQVALVRVESDYQLFKKVRRFPAAENNLPPIISQRSKRAVERLGRVEFVLLQGHPTQADLERGWGKKRNLPVSKWNVEADRLCNVEKSKYRAKQNLDNLINEYGVEVLGALLSERISTELTA